MRMNAGTIGASARPQVFGLWAALVAGIAVTALILSVVAVRLAVRTDHQAAPAAKEAATVSPLAVTGTGPGLVQVAKRSQAG